MARLVDQLTPVTPAQVMASLKRAWTKLFNDTPHRTSLLVLLSQWALETGRGRSMHCYNLGNVKSSAQSGDWCFFRCNEVINGKIVWFDPDKMGCCFRAFTSLDDGALDYLQVLHNRFRKVWPAVLAGDPADYSHLLKVNHYYTADESKYTATVVALFNEFSRTIPDDAWPSTIQTPDFNTVLGVQTALAALGYDVGRLDGIDGPRTDAAVRHFQLDEGLTQDGKVGNLTRPALAKAWAAHAATAA
jgi:hypothetical protein